MKELYDAGLTMVYVGAESGSDKVLQAVCKGETRQQIIDGVKKVEACGMKSSVTFHFRSCGKRRLGGSCDPDRNYDQRNGTILCWTSDIDRGAERSDGQGNRRWDIYSADSGRSYGGNAFDAGTHRCI